MVREREQGILAGNSARSNPGALGQVRDNIMESFERGEVVRGKEIINALPQEVRDRYRKLFIQQTTVRTQTTNIITQTKNDLTR